MELSVRGLAPVHDFQGVDKLLLAGAQALVCPNSAGKESVPAVRGLLQHVQRHPLRRHLCSHKSTICKLPAVYVFLTGLDFKKNTTNW